MGKLSFFSIDDYRCGVEWFVGKMLLQQLKQGIFGTREGIGNGHHGVCSSWYGELFSYMIGLVGVESDAGGWVVCVGHVDGWCVCIVDAIGVDRLVSGF